MSKKCQDKRKVHRKSCLKEILTYLSFTFGFLLVIFGILCADSKEIAIPIICICIGFVMFCCGTFELITLASSEKRVIVTKNLIVVRDDKQRDLCHIPKHSDFDEVYEIIKDTEDKNEAI